MLHTTDKLILREMLDIWRDLKNSDEIPALVRHYFEMPRLSDSWERKRHPDMSGMEIMGMIIGNILIQTKDALGAKKAINDDFPAQMWKLRFDQCVREMRDQIREDDIINKDVCMRELELFHGPGEDGGDIYSH